MPAIDLKTRLIKLPLGQKILLVGSFLTVLGAVLPWYSDIDKFNIGDTFLGITGPLYLSGFMVLLAGGLSLGIVVMKLLEKKTPQFFVSENQIHSFNSVLTILMLIISASVYFHPKFGVNLTDKTIGIGMIFDFIGALAIVGGVVVSLRGKKEYKFVEEDQAGRLEPLIDMEMHERERNDLGIDKNMSVGEAMEKENTANKYKTPNGWGMAEESINNVRTNDRE
ncbi:MAG: hypothetical protein AAB373_02435 [Patescibacteria group bacterium]